MTKNNNGMKGFLVGIGVGLAVSMLNKNNRIAVKKQSRKAKHKVLELKDNTAELTLKVKEQVSHVQKSIGEMSKDISVVKRKLDDIKPHVIRSLTSRKARQRKEETIPLPVSESTMKLLEEEVVVEETPLVEEVQAISSEEMHVESEEVIIEAAKEDEVVQQDEKIAK